MKTDAAAAMKFLVACPGCKRQFDAGGLAPGTLFHCSCGKTVKVPRQRMHDAKVVRCSSCSAPRVRGAESCAHCGADYTLHERDLHTICPSCMTRISDRARYCHHCATAIVPQGKAGRPTDTACPVCRGKQPLNSRSLGANAVSVLECPKCAGLWLGREAFDVIAERARTATLPEQLLAGDGQGGAAGGGIARQQGPLYRRCPECDRMMNRRNFGQRSGVVIDACKDHGFWFDAKELERILQWIRRGGEERSRRRVETEQRERSRHERFKNERLDRMAGYGPHPGGLQRDSSRLDLLGGFLGALFDI